MTNALDAEFHALLELHGAKTLKEFWLSARRVLRSAVPAAAIWLAPEAEWMPPSAALREETALKSHSQFERFQKNHPLVAFLRANADKHLATFGDVMTDTELLRSKFYREFMAPQRERFSVVIAFWHGSSLRAALGLNRLQNDRDFSRAELRTLRSLHGHLGTALNSVWELHRERSARGALEHLLAPLPFPIVVLDWELNVLYYNHAANESAARWVHPQKDSRLLKLARRFEVPAHVDAFCRELKAVSIRSDGRAKHSAGITGATIAHPTLPGFQASVRLVNFDTRGLEMPLFLVVFENTHCLPSPAPTDMSKFSHLARLSVREREVALLVCGGESNKEIAVRLGKSVLTVKAQLQSIYGKLGADGRGRLATLLQERSPL